MRDGLLQQGNEQRPRKCQRLCANCKKPVVLSRFTVLLLGLVALAAGGVISLRIPTAWLPHQLFPAPAPGAAGSPSLQSTAINVNFGGWLVLEAWMFAGSREGLGLHDGVCFPPAVLHRPWPSEGILVKDMVQWDGERQTIENFRLYRETFMSTDDLDDALSVGVQTIRLSFPWFAFADALIDIDASVYGGFDPDTESRIVPDPWYNKDAFFVTVPRKFIAQFLRNCSKRGLGVLLDFHTFPGAQGKAPFNGIQPMDAVFWDAKIPFGKSTLAFTDVGFWLVKKFLHWVEGLDDQARSAVRGVTLMNEPAQELNNVDLKKVFDWLAHTSDMFRNSYLPSRGVKLYVNFMQNWKMFDDFTHQVQSWYARTFSKAERKSWAVIDIHQYLAWNRYCEGREPWVDQVGYSCGAPAKEIRERVEFCLGGYLRELSIGLDGQLASAEMSLATDSEPMYACHEREIMDLYLNEQAYLFRNYRTEFFFWNWKIPYAPKQEEIGWSYQYHLGLNRTPPHECNVPS